jgi:hypothetical protein
MLVSEMTILLQAPDSLRPPTASTDRFSINAVPSFSPTSPLRASMAVMPASCGRRLWLSVRDRR